MSYIKYYKYKKQVSYDDGETWEDVSPEEYAPSGDPIGTYDTYEDCIAQYRVIQSGTTCVGVDKHNLDVYEVSHDYGSTWEVVSTSAGTLIEANSPDCGYVPPTSEEKYKLTLTDSSVVTGECDSTSAITSGEVATQYSGTVVSAEIGDCVTSIGNNAFNTCYRLTSVTIPNSVTSIGDGVFYCCSGITSINIPDSVTSIGDWAFYRCVILSSVTMSSGVTTIGVDAFRECSSLSSITIPDSVTSIGNGAFSGCSSLTDITIPNSVAKINRNVFRDCSGLTSVTIGSSVTSIGNNAFNGCSGLTSITVEATTPPVLGSDVFGYTNDCTIYVPCASVDLYKAASGWSDYASRIQGIPPCSSPTPTFEGKYKLILSDSSIITGECDSTSAVTSGEVASQYSGTVVSAEIGDCVTSIGQYAFYKCTSLSSITAPNSTTSIGNYAFSGCTSLSSIDIPSGVTFIGYAAFRYCSGLTSVTVEATTPPTLGQKAFDYTNGCPFYVPAESVETYKATINWSDYASRIRAIPSS